jgi:hypothetical protein
MFAKASTTPLRNNMATPSKFENISTAKQKITFGVTDK